MNIVAYGAGTNSTAMLVEFVKREIDVNLILFADTGGERPHTYAYVEMFSKWLVEHGMPEIITVKKVDLHGEILTLENDCLQRNMLPSIAYGFKSCSQKYKIQPLDKYLNNNIDCKKVWNNGGSIKKYVGFDADESHRIKDYSDKKYTLEYPLSDWDMGRDECIETIEKAGLCLPGKSACYFCPSSKPSEVRQLMSNYPELAKRALEMEAGAELTSIKGLGRNWAWADLLANPEMFEDGYAATPEMLCGCYDG